MAHKLITSGDLYRGFKLDKSSFLGSNGSMADMQPFQMLTQEQKTIDWIRVVADYYDICGWNNVSRKADAIQRNYDMRNGKITPSDYIINPELNPYSGVIQEVVTETSSPLKQFYPLAPPLIDALRGEFIKKDNTWTIEVIDPKSTATAFQEKESKFTEVITQFAQVQKQQALAQMGLTQESNPEAYQQEMQAAMDKLTNIELASKNYRTVGQKWAEKVLKIHDRRYNLHELEPDAFEGGLIADREFWHLDLLDDDFKVELLNVKWCDYHKSPGEKYVSSGDYFLWFDFMSAGDIINKLGRKMKEEDMLKMKDCYLRTANIIMPDIDKAVQGAYYDMSKPWKEATDLNPVMNDVLLGKELAYNYARNGNFNHNIDTDLFSSTSVRSANGHPQMFRVMRLYWRSMMRIGWLTKIDRDGVRTPPSWVTEDYKVSVEPQYDVSVVKDKTAGNLLYGEHIEWTWAPQWRHVIKISANHKHTYWADKSIDFDSVYIDGAPVKFQFKGRNNPLDSLPPVEGCEFSHINSGANSLIDRVRPFQILYNICQNKVPDKILNDFGNKLAIDKRSYSVNDPTASINGLSPREEYEDNLRNSPIVEYHMTRESLEGLGQPALPQVIPMSTIQESQMYFRLAQEIKMEAGEIVGISRQRLGKNMASDTAYGIEQGIQYSEVQTEKYFEQHANLMQRVRQRMLDAAQYYSTFKEKSQEIYMNEMDETTFLQIEGMENLLTHYNLHLQSRANVRAALKTISGFLQAENTLPIAPSAKLEALVSNSIPKILNLIRVSELEQYAQSQVQDKARLEQEAQLAQQMQEQAAQKMAFEAEQAALDRESAENIATIRALGGIQTDANASGQLDSAEALEPFFRQQEINEKIRASRDASTIQRQSETDKLLVQRETAQKKLEGDKYKADMTLKVAKENTRKKG